MFMHTKAANTVYVTRRENARPQAPLLSVIVPVFNEEEVILHFLRATRPVLERSGLRYE